MASINSIYMKKEVLQTLLTTLEAKNENGIEITVSLNDEENNYNQNVSAYVSQSKDDREAKKPRFYVGNGRTVWTNGKCIAFEYKAQGDSNTPPRNIDNAQPKVDDVPF